MNKQCGGSPWNETTSLKQALLDSIRISKVCMTSQTITPITGEDKLPLILLRDTTKTLNEFVRTVMPQFDQLWDTYLDETVSIQIVEKFKQILFKFVKYDYSEEDEEDEEDEEEEIEYNMVTLDDNTETFIVDVCKTLKYKHIMTLLRNRFDVYDDPSNDARSEKRVLLVTDKIENINGRTKFFNDVHTIAELGTNTQKDGKFKAIDEQNPRSPWHSHPSHLDPQRFIKKKKKDTGYRGEYIKTINWEIPVVYDDRSDHTDPDEIKSSGIGGTVFLPELFGFLPLIECLSTKVDKFKTVRTNDRLITRTYINQYVLEQLDIETSHTDTFRMTLHQKTGKTEIKKISLESLLIVFLHSMMYFQRIFLEKNESFLYQHGMLCVLPPLYKPRHISREPHKFDTFIQEQPNTYFILEDCVQHLFHRTSITDIRDNTSNFTEYSKALKRCRYSSGMSPYCRNFILDALPNYHWSASDVSRPIMEIKEAPRIITDTSEGTSTMNNRSMSNSRKKSAISQGGACTSKSRSTHRSRSTRRSRSKSRSRST